MLYDRRAAIALAQKVWCGLIRNRKLVAHFYSCSYSRIGWSSTRANDQRSNVESPSTVRQVTDCGAS